MTKIPKHRKTRMAETADSPEEELTKERYIEGLFASIAPRYDFLNSIISLNRHKAWRRFAVGLAQLTPGSAALDVAAGTGDFAIELTRAVGPNGKVTAIDFCEPMVEIGRRKTSGLQPKVDWVTGSAMSLPFDSNTFDCAVIGFALRNVADVPRAVAEMTRVVKPGGRVVSLELNRPTSALVRPFWELYFCRLVPTVARAFGGGKEPYSYLPMSVKRFYSRQELVDIMIHSGLSDVRFYDLTMGVVCAHVGVKP